MDLTLHISRRNWASEYRKNSQIERRLEGVSPRQIVGAVRTVLHDENEYAAMANAVNPYGDGRAAERTVAGVAHLLGLGPRPDEFRPELILDEAVAA